jgi:2-polyprenyl-6-methoxyphenol hydroxylase-like FAD-dependent oxidoreductase
MTTTEVDVVITGAGVGGAMLALGLARAGVRVLLAEPGKDIPTRGADILKPRGIHVLREHGVLPTLLHRGALCRDVIGYYHDGQPLFALDFTEHSDLGYFLVVPYRTLVESLLDASHAYPSVRVEFAAGVADIGGDGAGHRLRLHTGQIVRAAVVVGADGPRSPILRYLGAELAVRSYDHVLWSATLATAQAAADGNRLYFSSSGSFAYLYPVDATTARVFVGLPIALGQELVGEPGKRLVEHLGSFVPDHTLVALPADLVWQRVPMGSWQVSRLVRGSTAVLGHAAFSAHPMTGLGMSVTLEDATVLAHAMIEALYDGRPAGALLEQRYAPRQDLHRRLIAYGDALATSYPDPVEYRRRFQPRLHCGNP